MKQNMNIEVEGSELIIKNKVGDYVIIPKKYRIEVKDMIKENCHECIDALVDTLPIMEDYAEDGSLYSEYLTNDPPSKRNSLNTNPNYNLPSSFKGSFENPMQLDEVAITAKAPKWLKYRREYVKNNPFDINKYVENRFNNPVNAEEIEKINPEEWRKKLRQEGLEKRYNLAMNYVGEQLIKDKPQGKLSRVEWLNQKSDKEEEIIKRNPKYQSSLWADTKRGFISLVEQNPLQAFQNILNSKDYTIREKREILKDYIDHPIMSKLGDAAKILQPLSVPSKMVQSAYKDDYSFTDALKGKKNNAGIVEDIVTDPLNLVGAGLIGKLSKTDKIIDATKVGSKVLSKTDDVINLGNKSWKKYITQEEKVERILAQKNKIKNATLPENQLSWEEKINPFKVEDTGLGDDYKDIINLSKGSRKYNPGMTYDEFENAAKTWAAKRNDDLAPDMAYLGSARHNDYWGISKDFKGLPEDADVVRRLAYDKYYGSATPEQRVIIENAIKNHELDHFLYKNSRKEYDDIIKAFDSEKFGVDAKYLKGRKSSIAGDEIRARMAQLMDYFEFKVNPKTGFIEDAFGNRTFTQKHLDYARKNYIKDTNLDNSMSSFFNGIANDKIFIKVMNSSALSTIPIILYFQSQNQNKNK